MNLKPGDVIFYEYFELGPVFGEVYDINDPNVSEACVKAVNRFNYDPNDNFRVPVYWSDNTWSQDCIEKDDDYVYIGNKHDSDFENTKFVFAIKSGFAVPSLEIKDETKTK